MSFITSKLGSLTLGGVAEEAYQKILTELKSNFDLGLDWQANLNKVLQLAQANAWPEVETQLIQLLRDKFEGGDLDIVSDLLTSVGEMSEQAEEEDRQIGWPSKEWSDNIPLGGPFALDLGAEVGAWFEILEKGAKRDETLPALPEGKVGGELNFTGEASAKVSGSATIFGAALSGSAKGSLERAMHYHFTYQSREFLAGRALASALGSVRLPWDYSDVKSRFDKSGASKLDAIELKGGEGLGGDLKIAFAFPIGAGAFGLSIGGKAQFGNSFRHVITSATNKAGNPGLRIVARSKNTEETGFEFGASYKIGISSLLPGVAKGIVKQASKAGELLDKLDALIGDAQETWLKPGSLIKGEVGDWLSDALDEDGGDDQSEVQKRAYQALGVIFGIDGSDDLTDDLKTEIKSYTSDLVSDLLDDALDLLDISDSDLGKKAVEEITSKADEEVKKLLDDKVFGKIVPELNGKLNGLFTSADDAVQKGLKDLTQTLFGINSDDPVADLRKVIGRLREQVSSFTSVVESLATDMLAIEMGYAQEEIKSKQYDFMVHFDETAGEEYRKAILSPGKFGQLLISGEANRPAGVDVEGLLKGSFAEASASSSFGLSIGKFGFAAKQTIKSDAKFYETSDGVVVGGSSKGELKETIEFLKEKRDLTFITATSIYNLKKLQDAMANGTSPVEISPGTFKLAEDIPTVPPKFSLHFSEKDDYLRVSEAEDLLERYVEAGLVEKEISDSVQAAVRAARKSGNGSKKKVQGTLSVALAVPPTKIPELLKYGADQAETVVRTTMKSIASEHPESVLHAVRKTEFYGETKDTVARQFKGWLPSVSAMEASELLEGDESSRYENHVRTSFAILENLDTLIEQTERYAREEFRKERRSRSYTVGKTYKTPGIYASAVTTPLQELKAATESLQKTLNLGHQIHQGLVGETLSEEQLEDLQFKMVRIMEPMLQAGVPWGGLLDKLFGSKVPRRTVVLYKALQHVCGDALGVRPPLIVQLKLKGQTSQTFISPAA